MSFLRFFQIALALTLLLPSSANAADPAVGHWLTENERAVINLYECENKLCGRVYWIIDGGLEFDENNPLEELQTRKICDLKVVEGLEKSEEGVWEGGNIYKADDGDTYSADINIREDGTLKVRGYLGVSWLGKTQIWNRVSPDDYQKCS